MGPTHHVFLVPGVLGFAHLGKLTYFGHVKRLLTERLSAVGLEPRIHIVRKSPTASLPDRAARVAEMIDATAPRGGAPLHRIGHSSGGLDVRLLTAAGFGLPTAVDVKPLAACVRTVVTVSTPQDGTPIASFFTTLQGQRLMQLLSLSTLYVIYFGHLRPPRLLLREAECGRLVRGRRLPVLAPARPDHGPDHARLPEPCGLRRRCSASSARPGVRGDACAADRALAGDGARA